MFAESKGLHAQPHLPPVRDAQRPAAAGHRPGARARARSSRARSWSRRSSTTRAWAACCSASILGKDIFVIKGIVLMLIVTLGVAVFIIDLIYPRPGPEDPAPTHDDRGAPPRPCRPRPGAGRLGFLDDPRITRQLVVGLLMLAAIVLFAVVGPLLVDPEAGERRRRRSRACRRARSTSSAPTRRAATSGRSWPSARPNTLKIGLIAGLRRHRRRAGAGAHRRLLRRAAGLRSSGSSRDSLLTVPGIAILVIIAANVEQMTIEIMALTVAALAWMFPTGRSARRCSRSASARTSRSRAPTASATLGLIFREIMPNLCRSSPPASSARSAARCSPRSASRRSAWAPTRRQTLGMTIYWSQEYTAVLRGHLVVVGPADRDDRVHLPGAVRDLGRAWTASPTRACGATDGGRDPRAAGATRRPPAGAETPILRVEDLHVVYRTTSGDVPAVDGRLVRAAAGPAPRPDRRIGLGQDDHGDGADAADPAARPDHRRPGDPRRARPADARRRRAAQGPAARDRASCRRAR